ncbi:hypothetical protein [Pedobacter aquatilis]|uniref:hypothetical protein n=1 Tax=Pedobacter aquatilis TaxID=351343 RepID=UPI00292E9D9E|nr:hypothetical protein [Pedobacter aquatilis]
MIDISGSENPELLLLVSANILISDEISEYFYASTELFYSFSPFGCLMHNPENNKPDCSRNTFICSNLE